MKIENIGELSALSKGLAYMKYGGDNEILEELMLSPIVAEIFAKVLEEYTTKLKELGINDDGIETSTFFELFPDQRQNIVSRLKIIGQWDSIDHSEKQDIVKKMISPYRIAEEDVEQLIKQT